MYISNLLSKKYMFALRYKARKNSYTSLTVLEAGLIITVGHRTLSADGMIFSDETSKLLDIVSDEKQFSL